MTVLIIEDDLAVRRLVRHHLHDQGLATIASGTVAGARAAVRQQDFDIVILDLTLPDGSGLDLIDELRQTGSPVHIMVLSGAVAEDDRVKALGAGADDYVVKPFSVRELVARVLAVRRRLDPALDATLRAGDLEIDLAGRRVRSGGRTVELTTKEFDLLAFLAARPGAVFSREDLLRSVWRSAPEWQQAATVTEHIRRLRLKLESDPHHPRVLHTVRGAGYRFDAPGQPEVVSTDPSTADATGELRHVEGEITSADDAAAALLGVGSGAELVGRNLFDFVAPSSLLAAQERIRVSAGGDVQRSQLIDLRRPDGTEILVEVTTSPKATDGERGGRIVLVPMVDPSARLRHLATGLTSELSDAVIITDLHSHVRSWNTAAQRLYGWGEDEVLGRHVLDVLHGATEGDTTSAWQDLSSTGHWHGVATHLTRDGSTVSVWASTTILRDESGVPVGVISVNRLAVPTQTVDEASDGERATELRHAIERGELEVHYQPIVSFDDDRRVTTLEALVRWNHPARGLLSPASFIGVAERSGLIRELGDVVLRDACGQTARWRAAGLDVDVAVNLSSRELADPTLVDRVAATLLSSGLDPSALWLEVTETGLVEDVGQASVLLDGLAALGVGIAIDDFGTGWASLTYLREFPIHALKIDGSFVTGIGQSQNDAAIVRSIVSLGAELDLFVIAEGIETEAQLRALQALGCTMGQGFLFGRPTPASGVPTHRIRPIVAVTDAGPGEPDGAMVRSQLRVASSHARHGPNGSEGAGRTVVARSLGAVVGADEYDATAVDAATSMLRDLLRIRTAQDAAELLQRAAQALGASVVPQADAGSGAIPIDLALGEQSPLLAVAEPLSVAHLRLERLLPRLADDARQAVNLLRQAEWLQGETTEDTLAGLGNRGALDRVLQRASRGAVIALDLDHFKQLNECFGPDVGDQVLFSFARVLSREVRASDTTCRIGGQAFAVFADVDVAAAVDLVNRLRAAWTEQAPRPVTFSAGIASVGAAGGADALHLAREALHRAKDLGRDRTKVARDDERAAALLR